MSGTTIRSSGRTAFVLLPGDAGPGDTSAGRFYMFTGAVRVEVDDLGAFTDVQWTGDAVDVCSLIS